MVQVFDMTPTPSSAGMIGQALGTGFTKRAGLADAERAAEMANTTQDPVKLAFALARANMAAPGLERSLGPIYQSLLSRMATGGGLGQPGQQGSFEQPAQGTNVGEQPQPISETQPTSFEQLKKVFPDIQEPQEQFNPAIYGQELEPSALGMGPLPSLYTPQQITNQRLADQKSGFPESPKAMAMEKFNEQSRQQIHDYQNAAQTHSSLAQARVVRQNQFRDELKAKSGLKNEDDLATLETFANLPDFRNINNDSIRAQKAVSAFNNYQGAKASFEEGSVRPNYTSRDYPTKMDTLKGLLQPFIKYGQLDKAREILAKNNWSETEIAKITNPLDKSIEEEFKTLPNLSRNVYEHARNPKNMTDEQFVQNQQKSTKQWENKLVQKIKKGVTDPQTQQVFKPGTSLILLASEADRQGVDPRNFALMINNLIQQGKIELDDYQFSELGKIQKGLSRLKSTGEYLWGE